MERGGWHLRNVKRIQTSRKRLYSLKDILPAFSGYFALLMQIFWGNQLVPMQLFWTVSAAQYMAHVPRDQTIACPWRNWRAIGPRGSPHQQARQKSHRPPEPPARRRCRDSLWSARARQLANLRTQLRDEWGARPFATRQPKPTRSVPPVRYRPSRHTGTGPSACPPGAKPTSGMRPSAQAKRGLPRKRGRPLHNSKTAERRLFSTGPGPPGRQPRGP